MAKKTPAKPKKKSTYVPIPFEEKRNKEPYRLTKSKEALDALDKAGADTVRFVSTSIVQLCKDNNLRPGWALLGVCEFLAMMVHQNMPAEMYGEEIERFGSYIQDRLKEFNSHDITH